MRLGARSWFTQLGRSITSITISRGKLAIAIQQLTGVLRGVGEATVNKKSSLLMESEFCKLLFHRGNHNPTFDTGNN